MSTTTKIDDEQDLASGAAPAAPVIAGAGLGPQLAPWGAMGALCIAAGAARIAMHATGNDIEVADGIAGAAFTIAVVATWKTRRRLMSRRLRHRLVAALYLGAAWLSEVTYWGMSLGALAALTILGAGLSLLYWREHRIGPGIEPQLLLDLDGDGDLYIARWAENIGANGRALAGSRLTDPEIIKSGYRYTLQLVPGVQTVGMARNPEMLRGGLRLLPGQDVIVETHPELPSPAALLTIITRSPVRKPHVWPGPEAGFDPVSGSVNLGPFVDGEGPPAQWSVYKLDGMFGGYLQGGTGSGKSRMIEQIAMSCAASESHPTVVWFGDGQGGSSSPLLAEHADWFASDFSSIYNMLQAAVQVGKINAVENRRAGRVGFHPTAERPGLLVIVDECHKPLSTKENPLLAGPTQQLMSTIARELRKAGVGLILASQAATLDAFGGAGNLADVLRSNILAGNGVILRSKTSNAKVVFQVDIDPRQFPKLPGYAYLVDPDEDARSAPFRGSWVTDELAAFWPQRIIWRSLPRRQANMAGAHYARRREAAAEQAFADELLLQMADAGTLDEMQDLERQLDAAAASTAAGTSPDVVEFGDAHPPIKRVTKFWVPEPRHETTGLLPGQQKVLDAIRAGHTRPKQIQDATSYSESQVHNLLGELQAAGHISKAGYGQYQAAAA